MNLGGACDKLSLPPRILTCVNLLAIDLVLEYLEALKRIGVVE